jgi:thioredoxin 1
MRNFWKIVIVLLLASSVIAIVLLKNPCPCRLQQTKEKTQEIKLVEPNNASLVTNVGTTETQKLPRLVDLGADKCIPCKMMMPVLEELDKEYKGKLQVEFYDVWKNSAPAEQYGIRVIPTQIFLSPDGKELFRHEGYFSKEDILAKWKELGFDFYK